MLKWELPCEADMAVSAVKMPKDIATCRICKDDVGRLTFSRARTGRGSRGGAGEAPPKAPGSHTDRTGSC